MSVEGVFVIIGVLVTMFVIAGIVLSFVFILTDKVSEWSRSRKLRACMAESAIDHQSARITRLEATVRQLGERVAMLEGEAGDD